MTDVDSCCKEIIEETNSLQLDLSSSLFNSLNLNDIYEDIEEVIELDKMRPSKNKVTNEGPVGSPSNYSQNMIYQNPSPNINRPYPVGNARPGAMSNSMYTGSGSSPGGDRRNEPYVKILIQPAQKAHRFRYECEGRLAGCILGANSTPENKTYPTIQVINYTGKAIVVVSCVTRDHPHRPHPHKLVGKEGCKKGICTTKISNDNMVCSFSNLGIQCVKRKDIEDALSEREELKVDPYGSFAHKHQAGSIDLNCVRLCFQVFVEKERDKFTKALPPVVSEPIYDKKAMFDLVICKLSACSASCLGGTEIILLCEKIVRDDVQVRFYELRDGQIIWEELGDFQPTDVHKQVAISLKTPRYKDVDIQAPVEVFIQLRRPSDGATSESRDFQILPAETDTDALRRKRQKLAGAALDYYLTQNLGPPRRDMVPNISPAMRPPPQMQPMEEANATAHRVYRQANKTRIKQEPPDQSVMSPHYSAQPNPSNLLNLQPADYHLQPSFYYRSAAPLPGQFPAPMDTSLHPGAAAGGVSSGPSIYNLGAGTSHIMHHPAMIPSTSGSGVIGLHADPIRGLAAMSVASPEVITLPSYSSSGSNPSALLPSDHHSGESANLSLGLGSFDSFSLSGMSLSQIGSHLSDTFLCLNSDLTGDLAAGLSAGQDYGINVGNPSGGGVNTSSAATAVTSSANRDGNPSTNQMYSHERSREQSLDSYSRIQNLQDQIKELNQLGGDIVMSDSLNMDKIN